MSGSVIDPLQGVVNVPRGPSELPVLDRTGMGQEKDGSTDGKALRGQLGGSGEGTGNCDAKISSSGTRKLKSLVSCIFQ